MTKTAIGLCLALCICPTSTQLKSATGPTLNEAKTPDRGTSKVSVEGPLDYVCPMDADIRSDKPGVCPRCGMTLRLGVPDQSEYHLDLKTIPATPRPKEKVRLIFSFRDPKDDSVVKQFQIVHEKLFHMFIVSGDLMYFLHDHPTLRADGTFVFDEIFPAAATYRILADVYPTSGSPQLIAKTVFVTSGRDQPVLFNEATLEPSEGTQHGENTDVEITTNPGSPISGFKTILSLKLKQADGLQKYLGAWAHMLIASDDTIDLIHEHPFTADGGDKMQFDLIFPRARTYRIWIQFQRKGVVNTIAVNVPVLDLEHAAAQGVLPN